MTEPVTRGDRYDIPFTVNGNLTGSTTKVFARLPGAADVELAHTITDPANGVGKLTDTSALLVGKYRVELEAVNGTQRITYPLKGGLTINDDIG